MTSPRFLLSLCSVLFIGSASVWAEDWPQFLGPKRDATSSEKGLATTWPKDGPPVVWRRAVGEGFSGPVVSGGKLILFHRLDKQEVVECLDAATGKSHWKHAYTCAYEDPYGKGNGPRSTPVITGGKVYTLGATGTLMCLSLDDGKELWRHDLPREYKVRRSFFGVGSTPIVEGDLLVLNVGAVGAGIVAFDKNTGKEAWKATNQDASYSSPVAATIDGVRHLLFFTREGLVSLDPIKGAERFSKRWRSRMDASVNAATPLVIGGRVFITASYNTGALMLKVKKDGVEEVWSGDDILSCHYDTPVYHDGYLYGLDGREEGGDAQLRCIDARTGKVRWSKEGVGCASIILVDGHLLLLAETGELILADADPAKYHETARAALLSSPVRAHPALANGRLYARDGKQLVCWNMKKK